jgi:hypothetical protein
LSATALALVLVAGAAFAQNVPPAPPSAAPAAAPLSADTQWNGVSLQVVSVKRTAADTVTLTCKYVNSGAKDQLVGEAINSSYLIDGKNKKKYLPVKDETGAYLTSGNTNWVPAGQSKVCWAKFPAPPADVTAVTVSIPETGAPPFEDVSISQ